MFDLKDLTEEDINIIGSALSSMPYSQVFKLIQKLNEQISEQQK